MIRKMMAYAGYTVLLAGLALCLVGAALQSDSVQAQAGGNTSGYAWGTNVGWINFDPTGGGVTVYSDHLEGYAWGENIGWIRLGSHDGGGAHTYANDAANTYGVNHDGSGNLSGYAWSTTAGWINFNPTGGGVTIDTATGEFDDYAWGENVGWIHFKNASPEYGVVTTWTPTAVGLASFTAGGMGPAPALLVGLLLVSLGVLLVAVARRRTRNQHQ